MKKLIIALSFIACSTPALAAETLFSCQAAKGKLLSVTHSNGTLTYSFGRKGKPELVFRQPADDVMLYANKYGTNIEMNNGDYMYGIFYNPALKRDAGVYVSRGTKNVGKALCVSNIRFNDALFTQLVS